MLTKFHRLWLVIFLLSGVLGFLGTTQYFIVSKTNDRNLLDVNPNREILISIKENQLLKFKINELQDLLQNKQNIYEKNKYLENQYNEYLEKLAYLDVDGEGLVINLSGAVNVNTLIDLIHTLWFGGAKAISLNNVRINSNSYFSLVNNEILLNGIAISNPIKISLIGDVNEIRKYLFQPDGIIKNLKIKNITAEAQFFDVLRINK